MLHRVLAGAGSLVLAAGLVFGVGTVGAVGAGTAPTEVRSDGHWQKIDTRIWNRNDSPQAVVSVFNWSGANYPYSWTVNGSLTADPGVATVTNSHEPTSFPVCPAGSITYDYRWTQPPPDTASAGQAFPVSISSMPGSDSWNCPGLSPPPKKLSYTFDLYNVEPGSTSGTSYPGSGTETGDAGGSVSATLMFPGAGSSAGQRYRLQIQADRWAVQYGYEWVPGSTSSPTPAPSTSSPTPAPSTSSPTPAPSTSTPTPTPSPSPTGGGSTQSWCNGVSTNLLAEIWSTAGVTQPPTKPSVIRLTSTSKIQSVMTYHWNNNGTPPGKIALIRKKNGKVYGPWKAKLSTAVTPAAAHWCIYPKTTLPAGEYRIDDKKPATWSQVSGPGMVKVFGKPVG